MAHKCKSGKGLMHSGPPRTKPGQSLPLPRQTPDDLGPGSYQLERTTSIGRKSLRSEYTRPGPNKTSRLYPACSMTGEHLNIKVNCLRPNMSTLQQDKKHWRRKGVGASFERSTRKFASTKSSKPQYHLWSYAS